MAWRTNLILLGVVIVLGVVCVVDAHLLRTTEEREAAEKKVFDFEEDAIYKYRITRENESYTLGKGTDAIWYLTEPFAYRADQSAADSIPFELRTLRKVRTVESDAGSDLANLGLDEPRVRLQFWISDEPEEVLVGGDDPKGDVYVMTRGKEREIYTVRESFFQTLDREMEQYRERRLVPFETYNVQTFALQHGSWQMRWERGEDTWFVVSGDTRDEADPQERDEVLRRIQDLKALEFLDGVEEVDLANLGLDRKSAQTDLHYIQIQLTTDDVPKVVELGKTTQRAKGERVPARSLPWGESKTVLLLSADALKDFGRPFADFRNRKALGFSTYDVESFSYGSPGDELVVEKTGGDWMVKSPGERKADADEVLSLLRAFESLEIQRFVDDSPGDLAPYGLEGAMTFSVTTQDGGAGLLLERPVDEKTDVHAMRAGREAVFTIAPAGIPRNAREAYFRCLERRVLDFSTFDAKTLAVTAGGEEKTFVKEEGKWMGGEVERKEVREVVLDLSSLQAIRFVDDAPEDPAYGFDPPTLVVTVGMGEEKEAHTVVFGSHLEGEGNYARLKDGDLVFLANRTLVTNIQDLLPPPEEPSDAPEENPEEASPNESD